MKTFALLILASAALALAAAAIAGVPTYPVTKLQTAQFGAVLAGKNRIALYTWNRERDGKIRCTGACAKAWPPLLLPKGVMARHMVAGIKGTFGEIRRPDGRMQLTFNRRPLYSYEGDGPGQVKCNGVDGWFVVRLR